MSKNRRSNAVMFGFDFQVNADIMLMIESIENLRSLRLQAKLMKNVLLGNGINIQFGGKVYTNDFIMKRIKYRAL